ncbi:MAG: hypothetical protein MJ252_02555, partial [archaeon]|nr:hypothetical protein [archaeon]
MYTDRYSYDRISDIKSKENDNQEVNSLRKKFNDQHKNIKDLNKQNVKLLKSLIEKGEKDDIIKNLNSQIKIRENYMIKLE